MEESVWLCDVIGECFCGFSCLEVGIGLRDYAMTLGSCMLED